MKSRTWTISLLICLYACHRDGQAPATPPPAIDGQYAIQGNTIYHYSKAVQLIGVNAFHIFGAGGSDLNSWHLDIAREFVGNTREARLTGNPFKDSNGSYLYSLQSVVDSNRASNRITILCPFQWNGLRGTDFTGTMPRQTYWWNDFKVRLQQWAIQFKDQPDVWLEVWNEPYNYNRTDGYTDDTWMKDMGELVDLIRSTGNNNVVLVPGAEQGQDETVLVNKGLSFVAGRVNVLFDIHAYEKWLLDSSASVGSRLRQLRQVQLPVIFGETAPLNAGVLMNPASFLDSVYNHGMSVCGWVWKYDSTDKDALLTQQGQPNNSSNHYWGDTFKALSLRARR